VPVEGCTFTITFFSYSSELASTDYHLFLHPKKFLAGQSLKSVQETEGMQDWLKGLVGTFFNKGIQKLFA